MHDLLSLWIRQQYISVETPILELKEQSHLRIFSIDKCDPIVREDVHFFSVQTGDVYRRNKSTPRNYSGEENRFSLSGKT